MTVYTIYCGPLDYPNHFVVRRHFVSAGHSYPAAIASLCNTLDEAREEVPYGLTPFTRSPDDDPVIVETWI